MTKLEIKTHGFKAEDSKFYLTRCPECEKENYAMMVARGICAWCGYDANKEQVEEKKND